MESLESKKNNNGGVWRKLPPGFRFRPTDEELVVQYLWRKVLSFPLPSSIIPEIDLTDHDPQNLLSEREKEGYFFKCNRSTNNGSSSSSNSSNEEKRSSGYWKAIGKEMPILSSRSNKLVGMKKILNFFRGRCRTKWIMHEFRLAGVAAGIKSCMFTQRESTTFNCQEKEWVVCRIFKKRKEKRIHAKLMDNSTDSMIQVNKVSRISSSSSSSSSSSLNLSCVTHEVMEDSDNEDEFSSKSMDSS